jgi:hypothetical protein
MTKSDGRMRWAMAAALIGLMPVGAGAAEPVSESDRFFLDEAASACRNGDFPAFLWPFANSAAVRAHYGSTTTGDFPIVMMDYSYVTRASERLFEAEGGDPRQLVYVQVDFSTREGGIQRVDWVPGRFEPGEGDGPGTLIEKTGPGGSLTFRPAGGCWQLAEDKRHAAAGG